jgi:hypothetical protein
MDTKLPMNIVMQENICYIECSNNDCGILKLMLPTNMVNDAQKKLTYISKNVQMNNIIISLSVLKSAVVNFLGFEAAFKSLLSSGDDNTILYNLKKCVGELEQVIVPLNEAVDHPFSFLVVDENPLMTNFREINEQCVKIIEEFLPLLGGRNIKTSTVEIIPKVYGWRGWIQQSQQIKVSNSGLKSLLMYIKPENDIEINIYNEIKCFCQCVDYVIEQISVKKYPQHQQIEKIYSEMGLQSPVTSEDNDFSMDESETKPKTKGWGLFAV